jgi:hypothetical protein
VIYRFFSFGIYFQVRARVDLNITVAKSKIYTVVFWGANGDLSLAFLDFSRKAE